VDWNEIAEQSVVVVAKHPPPVAALDFAILHAAIYDAVEAIDGKYRPYHVVIPGAHGSLNAAASKAAHDILVFLFPAQQVSLDDAYASYFSAHGLSTTDPGVDVGAQAAAGIIALRSNDGRFPPNPPANVGNTATGQWRPMPSYNAGQPPAGLLPMLTPWVANVKLFALKSNDQFMPAGPTPLDSREWQKDYNETKDFGSLDSTVRTAEQTTIGLFWADSGPLLWQRAQRDLATRYLRGPAQSARMFRADQSRRRRRPDRVLALQRDLQLLAASHRHLPRWRHSQSRGRPELEAAHQYAELPRVHVRPHHLERGGRGRAQALLPRSRHDVHGDQQVPVVAADAAHVRSLRRRAGRGHRRVRLGGHPLAHFGCRRRHVGQEDRQLLFSRYLHRADDEDEGDRAAADNDRGPNGDDTTDPNDDGADISSD